MTWLLSEPQIDVKLWLFTQLHYITPQIGSLWAKVSSYSGSADFSLSSIHPSAFLLLLWLLSNASVSLLFNLAPPLFLTLSKENGRWGCALLMAPHPHAQSRYLMAHLWYSHQNNWNSVLQNHQCNYSVSGAGERKKKRKTEQNRTTSSAISGSCFHQES